VKVSLFIVHTLAASFTVSEENKKNTNEKFSLWSCLKKEKIEMAKKTHKASELVKLNINLLLIYDLSK